MLLTADGKPRLLMQTGDQKLFRAGRVQLVLGPEREVEIIRSIYDMFLKQHIRPYAIAQILSRQGHRCEGRPWTPYQVKKVLTNPKYMGMLAWGRTECKLKSKVRPIPPERWITKANAFPAIVDEETFRRAFKTYYDRTDAKTDEQLLQLLRKLWRKRGHLSSDIIDGSLAVPDKDTYIRRFGSLTRTYELIGFKRPSHESFNERRCKFTADLKKRRMEIISDLIRRFPGRVIAGPYEGYIRCPKLRVDVAVTMCPCVTGSEWPRWTTVFAAINTGSSLLPC